MIAKSTGCAGMLFASRLLMNKVKSRVVAAVTGMPVVSCGLNLFLGWGGEGGGDGAGECGGLGGGEGAPSTCACTQQRWLSTQRDGDSGMAHRHAETHRHTGTHAGTQGHAHTHTHTHTHTNSHTQSQTDEQMQRHKQKHAQTL